MKNGRLKLKCFQKAGVGYAEALSLVIIGNYSGRDLFADADYCNSGVVGYDPA